MSTTRRFIMQAIAALIAAPPVRASESITDLTYPQIFVWSDGRMAIWNEKRGWLPLPR